MLPLDMVAPGIQAAKKHADQTRGQSGHKLGPPHPHVWRALLLHWVRAAEGLKNPPTAAIAKLKAYCEDYCKVPQNHLMFIRQARAKEVRDEKGVVHWMLSPMLGDELVEVDKAIMEVVGAIGGDMRPGTAPPCPLERNLQKRADHLADRLGGGKAKGKGKDKDKAEQ